MSVREIQTSPLPHSRVNPGDLRPFLLASALRYAERGMAVHPLLVGGKEPRWSDWEGRATLDPELITRTWSRAPFNIGVACGPSRLVVVDLDVPHMDDEPNAVLSAQGIVDGRSSFSSLIARTPGASPVDTMTVETCSGGEHLLFAAPEGVEVRCSARTVGPWIDTRAVGGYVVGIGSHVDGHPYRLTSSITTPAPLPGWLLTVLTTTPEPANSGAPGRGAAVVARLRAVARQGSREQRWARGILASECAELAAMEARSGRNDRLNKAAFRAGQLVAAGLLGQTEAENALVSTARECGVGTSSKHRYAREIEATVASGMRAGLTRPRFMDARARQLGGAA
ncbi:bifunctional DNA primase/polymerase [Kitasatospora sp. NPDC059088]|uniref:bifunctional DNA primase/polymerase n=1 Tax=Kitasatospora sp. NPDC059088 TaxID=3346722 RepID=UPI00368E1101